MAPLRLTLLLGALTAFAPMSIDMYLPSLPAIEREFGAAAGSAQATLAAFFAGLAIGQAAYGPAADRWGRRPPLIFGLSFYLLASIGCAFATGIGSLAALRFAQALGGCAGMVIARAVVRDLFDAQQAARMFSLLVLIMGAAPILAPFLGAQILLLASWRAIFWALALFGAVCLAACALGLPETRPATTLRPRSVGAALVGYARLLADRRFLGYALAGGVAQAGLFAYITGSPALFIETYGVPPQRFGWLFAINAVGLIGASQVNGWLMGGGRARPYAVLRRANFANAACALALLGVALAGGGPAWLLPALFGSIATLGFIQPNAMAEALAAYPERAGSASALLGTVQFTVGALAGMAVGALHDGTALPMAAVIAACACAALAAQLLLVGRARAQGHG